MTLFSSARGRIALALLLVGGVTYVLLLGSAFDHLGVPAVVGWRPSGETAPNSYSSSNSGSWSPAKAAADRINRLTDVTSVTLSPACAGWDPHAGEENDPPDCLRAKQFRELQTFKNLNYEHAPGHKESQIDAINHLELCILGYRVCPERPLILSDYWYASRSRIETSGEGIWLDPVVQTLIDVGFAFFPSLNGRLVQNWNLTRIFEHTLHQYWTLDRDGFQCLNNPRCVRQEDFRQHPNVSHHWDLDTIPKEEIGRIPAWRLFMPTFWGTRPLAIGYPGVHALNDWGQGGNDIMQEWSLHILGQKWQITPYDYPGHSWLPLTVEHTCLAAPSLPWERRKNQVLILAKKSSYFYADPRHTPPIAAWEAVVAELAKLGYEVVTVAKEEPEHPIPQGIKSLGLQSKHGFEMLVASSKAMIGIGFPEISPSPFNAICAGVPVVMPYWGTRHDGWFKFAMGQAQHGPVNMIGEPYAYPYNVTNVDDMVRQLLKAINTPISSYIPPDYRLSTVRQKTIDFIFHDWEAEYNRVKEESGGRVPEYDPIMLEKCIMKKHCVDPGVDAETIAIHG